MNRRETIRSAAGRAGSKSSAGRLSGYFRYLVQCWFPVLLLFIVVGIDSLLLFAQPFIFKLVYDDLIPTFDARLATIIIFSLLFVFALTSFVNFLTEIISIHIRGRLTVSIRGDVASEIMFRRYSFFQKIENGSIVQRLIPEIDTLASSLAASVKAMANIFQLLLILGAALAFNFYFFLICATSAAVYFGWHAVFKRPIGFYTPKVHGMLGDLYGFMFEHLQLIKTIKLFNIHSLTADRLAAQLHSIKINTMLNDFFRSILSAATKILDIAILAAVIFSFHRISNGNMSVGFYLVFIAVLMRLVVPFNFLIEMGSRLQSGEVAASRIGELRSEDFETSGGNRCLSFSNGIEFRDVHFSFEDCREVLSGVSFTISPGSSVAFVGASGSGKSTIIQLMLRLYDPTSGTVLLDGIPAVHYDLTSLRDAVGVLSQDLFLFNDTVLRTIDPHCSLDRHTLDECLHRADLPDFTSRLDSGIGENGCILSGGERQRLSIARLFARKLCVMVLDEATSSLDPYTEQTIFRNIQLLKQHNPLFTLIMITHRTSQLDLMDRIFFIDSGIVADSGRHHEMEARNHRYSSVLQILNAS